MSNRIVPINETQENELSVRSYDPKNKKNINRAKLCLFQNYEDIEIPLSYSKNKPILNWNTNNKRSIYYSDWNSLKGINICFCDESETKNKISIIIEINTLILKRGFSILFNPYIPYLCNDAQNGIIAFGYFFEKNPETKKMNMTLRIKSLHDKEQTVVYKDCEYFAINYDNIYTPIKNTFNSNCILQSYFTISNEWQDKSLRTGVNFADKSFQDFKHVVEKVNNFIQNNKIKEHLIPDFIMAYPLLDIFKYSSSQQSNHVVNDNTSHSRSSHHGTHSIGYSTIIANATSIYPNITISVAIPDLSNNSDLNTFGICPISIVTEL
jgi:hypothetical protein